jgi:hypothetical protein
LGDGLMHVRLDVVGKEEEEEENAKGHLPLDVVKEEEEENAKGHLPVQYVYVSFITVVLYYLDILK